LKNNTAPNGWSYNYTGILDKKTNVIYNINLTTLLHLGATSFVLNPDDYDAFFRRGDDFINQHKRIGILGLHAPALYFYSLRNFDKMGKERQEKRISDLIF
jgi:hypothetical protein